MGGPPARLWPQAELSHLRLEDDLLLFSKSILVVTRLPSDNPTWLAGKSTKNVTVHGTIIYN